MIEIILLIFIALGVWGIYYTVRNAHTEIISGLESLNEKLAEK